MITRRDIAFASDARLQARLEELMDDIGQASWEYEADEIDKELEARWYARHEDSRVRQAMGCSFGELPS